MDTVPYFQVHLLLEVTEGQQVFLDFRKSFLIRNDGAPKTSGVELWVEIWDFLPYVKMGEGGGIIVSC